MNARNIRTANGIRKATSTSIRPEQRLEQADRLQHEDRRHDGRRDDQAGEHQRRDERAIRSRRRCST